jgi:HlyD family secretion protein
MKTIIIIVLALVAAGGGWWYWKQSRPAEVKYQTGAVTRGDVVQVVNATGQLNPVVDVTIGSQISGNIAKVLVDFNSQVKAGQEVAEIEKAPYTASVHQAEANVAYAKAALQLAKLTADRKQELVNEHAAAQADLDTAVANFHQAEATVQINQANLETAQINLDHCTITSPIGGIVISSSVTVGETVAASFNAPVLFTVANDLAKMQIDASVAEGDVGEVETGQAVNFNVDAYPARTFHGTVAQVRNSPVTVQNVVTYDTVVSVNNSDLKLKPGMTANLYIVVAQRLDALRIPNAALRFRPPDDPPNPSSGQPSARPPPKQPGTKTIYVLDPGATKPHPVNVKLGISDGIYTEVADGLHEGDQVVTGILSGGPSAGGQGGGFGMRRPF